MLLKGGPFLFRSYYVVEIFFSEYTLHSLHQKKYIVRVLYNTRRKVTNDMKQLEVTSMCKIRLSIVTSNYIQYLVHIK